MKPHAPHSDTYSSFRGRSTGDRDVHSGRNSTDQDNDEEILHGPSVLIYEVLRYSMNSFTTFVTQLQLWHLFCLVFVQSVGEILHV
jgi:hypothetical protein